MPVLLSVNHCHLWHPSSELMEHFSCQDIHLSLYHVSVLPLPSMHHSASTVYLLLSTMTTSRNCAYYSFLRFQENFWISKRAIRLFLYFILSLLSFILHLSREAQPKASSKGVYPHSLVNSHFGGRGLVNSNNSNNRERGRREDKPPVHNMHSIISLNPEKPVR